MAARDKETLIERETLLFSSSSFAWFIYILSRIILTTKEINASVYRSFRRVSSTRSIQRRSRNDFRGKCYKCCASEKRKSWLKNDDDSWIKFVPSSFAKLYIYIYISRRYPDFCLQQLLVDFSRNPAL